jgi:hypothetical protein
MTQTATTPFTVDLPGLLANEIEITARRQQRSPSDILRELIIQSWSALPALPDDVEAELAAFTNLSDDVLWLLARSTLTQAEQEALAHLNSQAKQNPLTPQEEARLDSLLQAYDRAMVRRAQAVLLLKARGYDVSDPNTLQNA